MFTVYGSASFLLLAHRGKVTPFSWRKLSKWRSASRQGATDDSKHAHPQESRGDSKTGKLYEVVTVENHHRHTT